MARAETTLAITYCLHCLAISEEVKKPKRMKLGPSETRGHVRLTKPDFISLRSELE